MNSNGPILISSSWFAYGVMKIGIIILRDFDYLGRPLAHTAGLTL